MSDIREASVASSCDGIFGAYAPADSFYDEVFERPGVVRPAWKTLVSTLNAIGRSELKRRWSQAQEELGSSGIAYDLYDDTVGLERPWRLDLLPQLIGADEWNRIASGLRQRARLLNRVLEDVYGPQHLLSSGLLPPDYLFSHPGFRRAFHGQQPRSGTFLHFYAADLARAPDGGWWIVGDRADAPLGIGYALENRIVAARSLPHAIRDLSVERLAPFFMTVQETLRGLAPTHRENPRIVLLSHGPRGPNYFEDAYLARYLGYTLVEGGDLAVRDDRVFLKTLAGLLPVDVILRRLSDEYCDPLELRADPTLGVPGLLQVARLGHVAVVNAFGSAFVESPSLMPFLPAIAREWLGEELELPSVATWWCGQEQARSRVESQIQEDGLRSLALRSAFRVGRMEATQLEYQSVADALKLLATRPRDLIAQESVQRSTSPVLWESTPTRWHVAIRVYLVASPGGYEAMPGALVRLAQEPARLDRSILGGELTQDAWVCSSGPIEHVSLLATSKQPVVLRRSGAELPSRVADNLFWFGRQIERGQGVCRLLRQTAAWMTSEDEVQSGPELQFLIRALVVQGQLEQDFAVRDENDLRQLASMLPSRVLDEAQPGSLRSLVAGAHRNASLVRDRLSLDSWRIVHELERKSSSAVAGGVEVSLGLVELDLLLDDLIVLMAAFDGLIGESMTRSPAWRFLDLGRRLERSLHVVSLVQSLSAEGSTDRGRVLEALLEVADSIMTYRSRYLSGFALAAALDLLLTDETNPRALIYQLTAIVDHIANLPRTESEPLGTADERIAGSLLHNVKMLNVEDLTVADGDRTKLERLLHQVAGSLPKLSDLVSHRYLVHAGRPQQMSEAERTLQ